MGNDSLPHPAGSLKSGLPQFLLPDSRPERTAGTALQASFGFATCPAVLHPSQDSPWSCDGAERRKESKKRKEKVVGECGIK